MTFDAKEHRLQMDHLTNDLHLGCELTRRGYEWHQAVQIGRMGLASVICHQLQVEAPMDTIDPWVAVDSALPEVNGPTPKRRLVLIFNHGLVALGYWHPAPNGHGHWTNVHGHNIGAHITHWAPLPLGPKQEKET